MVSLKKRFFFLLLVDIEENKFIQNEEKNIIGVRFFSRIEIFHSPSNKLNNLIIKNFICFFVFLERLTSITKSTYLFVQQLITLKLLDLDNDEYEKIPHRYRTRVDADAAALELLCLSCDDEIGKENCNSR